jgi:uncharacterized HAD superfamily protein
MRLGIDFDGTIADTTDAKIRYALERFGETVTATETYSEEGMRRLGEERFREMVEASHGTEWTLTMQPMPGAVEALHDLGTEHELFVVTARNDDEIGWAREWLEPHGLPFIDVVHTSRESKAIACDALAIDLMLDDSPYVLRQLEESRLQLALIDAEYNRAGELPERTHRVEGWTGFADLVGGVSAD